MKKIVSLFLVCAMVFSLCACGKEDVVDNNDEKSEVIDNVEDKEVGQSDVEDSTDFLTTDVNEHVQPDIENNKDDEYIKNNVLDYKIGDYITFGSYEQDNNIDNGKEEIEWLVLDTQGGKALVISKYALDSQTYNTVLIDVTWETCTLRQWLNNEFLNKAFTESEKDMISSVSVPAGHNDEYNIDGGKTTQDKIFLLSIEEAYEYFGSDEERLCEPTAYAVYNGVYLNTGNNLYGCWYLRSPGSNLCRAAYVKSDLVDNCSVVEYGTEVNNTEKAVRPAMWIEIE